MSRAYFEHWFRHVWTNDSGWDVVLLALVGALLLGMFALGRWSGARAERKASLSRGQRIRVDQGETGRQVDQGTSSSEGLIDRKETGPQ